MFGFFKKKSEDSDVFYIKFDYDKLKKVIKKNNPDIDDDKLDDLVYNIDNNLREQISEKRILDYDDFVETVTESIELSELELERLSFCDKVDNFIRFNTEALNSIRFYANTICYGSAELKLDEYRVIVVSEDESITEEANAVIEEFEKRSKIKRLMYTVSKDLVKYGDALLEKIKNNDKLVSVAYLPSNSFYFHMNDDGTVKKFYQILDRNNVNESNITKINDDRKVIEFDPDEVFLFSDGTLPGEVDSPLYGLVEVWFNLKLIEESLVIHRISRAKRLLVFFLDVTGKTRKKIQLAISNFTSKLKSIFNIKIDEGDIYSRKSVLKQGNDIVIPITKNSETKVQQIEADTSAIQIDDIKFYHSRIVKNMLTSYIFEKADGSEKYMEKAFIKVTRTLQKQIAYVLEDLYKELLESNGITDCKINIIFPSPDIEEEVKIVDTIMRRMMIVSQLTAVVETKIPIEWVIKYIFKDLTQPELQELINLIKETKSKEEDQEYPSIYEEGEEEIPNENYNNEENHEENPEEYISLDITDFKESRVKKNETNSNDLNKRLIENIKIVQEYLINRSKK